MNKITISLLAAVVLAFAPAAVAQSLQTYFNFTTYGTQSGGAALADLTGHTIGNATICILLLSDSSLDDGSRQMLKEVGVWLRCNGEGIYGSRAWKIPGEGEMVNGKLKQMPFRTAVGFKVELNQPIVSASAGNDSPLKN
jgi:hypothetical protein